MKLGLHVALFNKKIFLDFFIMKREQKLSQYFFNIKNIFDNKDFSSVLDKVLFKFLFIKNIQENNIKLIK